jgi:hypothetical protein
MGRVVVGEDVASGVERWTVVVAEVDLGAPAMVVGAAVTRLGATVVGATVVGAVSVATESGVTGDDGTAKVTCDVRRPGALRPASTANSPAPATEKATTVRVIRFRRRRARLRTETRW